MEGCPHLIFWMPSCHRTVWCKSKSSRKKHLVHWQCRLPQGLRRKSAPIVLLVAEHYSLLLWGGFSNSWIVREFSRIWAHYIWYYRKPSPTCSPAQSSSFLDYPSNQSFSKFHVMLTSCIWHHSSFGKKETVLLKLSQRQNIWLIKPSKPDTINMVHSPSSSSLQPLPLAVT